LSEVELLPQHNFCQVMSPLDVCKIWILKQKQLTAWRLLPWIPAWMGDQTCLTLSRV